MAMACLGLVTFLPLRPDLSLPRFISLISVSTFLPAEGEYLRREDFFADDFFADDFFAEDFFAAVLLLVLLFFAEDLFCVLLDLFFAAFLVAIDILLENQMFSGFESVVWEELRSDLSGELYEESLLRNYTTENCSTDGASRERLVVLGGLASLRDIASQQVRERLNFIIPIGSPIREREKPHPGKARVGHRHPVYGQVSTSRWR